MMHYLTGGPKGASKIKNKIYSEYINVSNNVLMSENLEAQL